MCYASGMIPLADFIAARARLSAYLVPTRLEAAPELGDACYLKLENTQPTHSFKVRGALNAVLSLDEAQRSRGLVAASSGNHAQALAYAAHLTGIPATIVMPASTPQRKVNGTRYWGATALVSDATYDEAEAHARRIEQADGLTFISPYNDARVIAGAGTIGLELVEQLPDIGRVIVCVGGGGLISGIGSVMKQLRPQVEVIGVNPVSASAMFNHLYGSALPENYDTLADALSGGIEADSITLDIVPQVVDRIVTVTEAQIAAAMRFMLGGQGWLVEGGGAVGVAAWLSGLVPADDVPTAIIISGANVDLARVQTVLAG